MEFDNRGITLTDVQTQEVLHLNINEEYGKEYFAAKKDQGKTDFTYLSEFKHALELICKLSEFGATKYSRKGWSKVPDAQQRYTAAMLRHHFKDEGDGNLDEETCIAHDVAVAWNALAKLEYRLLNS